MLIIKSFPSIHLSAHAAGWVYTRGFAQSVTKTKKSEEKRMRKDEANDKNKSFSFISQMGEKRD